MLQALKRFVMWEYSRGCWQYDVMVGVILAFLFLTPRSWFRDQPRIAKASDIAMLPAEGGLNVFFLEGQLLAGIAEEQQPAEVAELLRARTGRAQSVIRVEPIFDHEGAVKGYMAFSR
jgi:hypothetical protein